MKTYVPAMGERYLNRVAVIGCQDIDVPGVYTLAKNDAVDEVILIGYENRRLAKAINQLLEEIGGHSATAFAGDYPDAAEADIAVIAAGTERMAGEPQIEFLRRSASAIKNVTRILVDAGFKGIFLVATNPIDILAQAVLQESGFPAARVIGLGMANDGSSILPTTSVEVSTWCSGKTSNVDFMDNCDPDCPYFENVLRKVQLTPAAKDSFVSCSLATCVTRICEGILRNEHIILPVSTMATGQYGISGVYLCLPCVIGRNGIEKIIEHPIDAAEREQIVDTATQLRSINEKLLCPPSQKTTLVGVLEKVALVSDF